jgi:hypothetical protein
VCTATRRAVRLAITLDQDKLEATTWPYTLRLDPLALSFSHRHLTFISSIYDKTIKTLCQSDLDEKKTIPSIQSPAFKRCRVLIPNQDRCASTLAIDFFQLLNYSIFFSKNAPSKYCSTVPWCVDAGDARLNTLSF